MKYFKSPFALAALTLLGSLVSGCASQGMVVGEQPSDPPPQIVFLGAHDAKGVDYLTWENVSSFGQVPPELKAAGDLGCMRIDITLRALGYHPKARNRAGETMDGGGFFCQPPLVATAAVSTTPPKLITRDGQLAWDRPGAFGAIPESQLLRAQQQCQKVDPKSRALGYHPDALGAQGQAIPGGGFLCVQAQPLTN